MRTQLTIGHILRHAPARGGQGLEAALIDVAQDILLRELHALGALEPLAFKGGTALRKLYAGGAGRFSTDLDFSVRRTADSASDVMDRLTTAIGEVAWGPFRYEIYERRGKPHVRIHTDLAETGQLSCKLDVSPPPWLPATQRAWVPMSIHARYGDALPELPVVRIEENVAEKIARLNRTTPARDAYDLVWIMQNRRRFEQPLDLGLIRRLAVLKAWVDANGLTSPVHEWKPAHEPRPLNVSRWLRERSPREFDDESIGLLATPPPALDELGRVLSREYAFLRELAPDEKTLSACSGRDRSLALKLLSHLPESQLPTGSCW